MVHLAITISGLSDVSLLITWFEKGKILLWQDGTLDLQRQPRQSWSYNLLAVGNVVNACG